MAKRDAIDNVKFFQVYVPAQRAGKTALEIARELGINTGDDKKDAQAVSQRATNLRKSLGDAATAVAKAESLDEIDTANLVDAVVSQLPTLTTRAKKSGNLLAALDAAIAACDAPPEEGEEAPE